MINPWTTTRVPVQIRHRRWWLIPLLAWALGVSVSLYLHLDDLHRQGIAVASEGARNLFNMVVLTRTWNAGHGGVYVPVSDKAPVNPYLDHPRRDLITTDGKRLTMINPAYMTRQIGELARDGGGTVFHITSLKPIRPMNEPDSWESVALAAFERGVKEVIELQANGTGATRLRYMAPLKVMPPCMVCHAKQGYKVGDIRGGISVSLPFDPIVAASAHARQQTWLRHAAVFLLIALLGWAVLELLRRRWHDLADNLTELEGARNAMQIANTELARARDSAEAASRSKSAFLSAMSHELRTPLNGILGFAHLLQRADLPDKAIDQVRRISEQGGNLLTLVNEVMEFTRLESLEAPLQQGSIDLAALLASLADELRRAGSAKGLYVSIDLAPDLPARVAGEREWLIGCLRPMLLNAVKFTDRGQVGLFAGKRTSATEMKGTYHLRVTLSDTGIGIAEADQDKLFEPFRQIDDARTRRYGGLGLGLAISARYAELLGGRLSCESAPGQGSRFHFDWLVNVNLPEVISGGMPDSDPGVMLDDLEHLLGEDDLRSVATLQSVLPILAQTCEARDLALLVKQIQSFDYPAALSTLRDMRRQG